MTGEMTDQLAELRADAEALIEGAGVRLDEGRIDRAVAWGTIAAAKATLYLAEVIRTHGVAGPPKPPPVLPGKDTDRCAICEGTFPESALNYSSGDPTCAGCFTVFNPKPIIPRDEFGNPTRW